MYIYWKENNTKSSCIINSNIIYLLENSLIEHGNLSKGGEGGLWGLFTKIWRCVLNLFIAYLLDSVAAFLSQFLYRGK
jgi:hypothetical protein